MGHLPRATRGGRRLLLLFGLFVLMKVGEPRVLGDGNPFRCGELRARGAVGRRGSLAPHALSSARCRLGCGWKDVEVCTFQLSPFVL
ncbi:hypothetical protein ACRRTK_006124 [Alexandromys fortis]